MLTATAASAAYRKELGPGLVLRWSTAADTENIAQLSSMVFRNNAGDPPSDWTVQWIHHLMSGNHPLMGQGDYGVVEDTNKEGNPLVASMCLLRQDWEYEGIIFRIGRPEIVATDLAYRNRGLIRALFSMLHTRSEAEGHLLQGITGIPYFYRQFGYEYALDLGGVRRTFVTLIPKAKVDAAEPYRVREAITEDIPLIRALYTTRQSTSIVWSQLPEHYLQYQFQEWANDPQRDREHSTASNYRIIVDNEGTARGSLSLTEKRWGSDLTVYGLDVLPGANLPAMLPSILRALKTYGEQMPTVKPDTEPFDRIVWALGRNHPVYTVLGKEWAPSEEPPYAWYIRVPNVPAFVRHITPALEQRLSTSTLVSYTGELKIDFYRSGMRLVFEHGRITTVEPWQNPPFQGHPGAGFPPLVFLQLLFGYRSLDDLRYAFPDIWANQEAELLLKALFPARPSFVLPL